MEELVGGIIVGDEHIHEPVVIVIGEYNAHSLSVEFVDAHLGGHVGKGAVTVVAIERVGERLVVLGMTVGAHPGRSADGVLVYFPLAVIGDEEVQIAIVVEIEPSGRDGPHLPAFQHAAGQMCLVGDVGESAVVIVAVQTIRSAS